MLALDILTQVRHWSDPRVYAPSPHAIGQRRGYARLFRIDVLKKSAIGSPSRASALPGGVIGSPSGAYALPYDAIGSPSRAYALPFDAIGS
eukprot:4245035-Pyramimonas_sp.AAC.1